jgi:hypothetical protein
MVTLPAHAVFLLYQLRTDIGPPTIVNSLMFMLCLFLHLGEVTAMAVLLLRLIVEEASLDWYQNHPGLACLILFPR